MRTSYTIHAAFILGLMVLVPLTAAMAQTDPSAAAERVQGQIREQLRAQEAPAPVLNVTGAPASQAPKGADKIKFTLKNIEIQGATAYKADVLRALYADRIGQTVSLADIYDIAGALTAKYRNDGYILTQVVVPPQTIDGGIARLRVVEGTLDKITVQGGNDRERALIQSYADQIKQKGAVNAKDLERALLLINDLPGVEARSVLSPSSTPGAADLLIIPTRDAYEATVGIDNYGSRFLGQWEAIASAAMNGVLGFNERIAASVAYAPGHNGIGNPELGYGELSYLQPVGRYGTTAGVSGSIAATQPGLTLDESNVRGIAKTLALEVNHPFIRTRNLSLFGYGVFDMRSSRTRSDIDDTREDQLRVARIGGKVENVDSLFGAGFTSLDAKISKGLNVFGASDKGDDNLSRATGDPQFTKFDAELQRLQRLTRDFNLLVAVKGQFSNGALLSAEEFGFGGINYGRGYDPSEIVGDDGLAGKAEIQWNRPVKSAPPVIEDHQFFAFYDAGRAWNDDKATATSEVETRTSAGIGARASLANGFETGLTYALPLNDEPDANTDQRVYFNLSKRF